MSETPNNADQPTPAEPTGPPAAEQPGYWESQAASTPPTPPSPGVQFNPQTGYPSGASTPPPYPGTPYPQQPAPPPQAGYGQPQQPYGQPGYPVAGQPLPGYGYPTYGGYPVYTKPENPQANTALIVGIIGLAGGLTFCGVPLLASPFAWVIGQRAKNEIDRDPNRWGGRDKANTGMILGIIGTVLLALALIAIVILVVVAASDPTAFE